MQKLSFYPFLLLITLLTGCQPKSRGPVITFTTLNTGTDAGIRALQVVDEHTVWASASKGTFLMTTDGGDTWRTGQIEGEEQNDFRSLHAWDANRAMVVGVNNPARFYLTCDGGATWQVTFEIDHEGIFFNSLKFANDTLGLALSDPIDDCFYVVKTEDGGHNWRRIENMPPIAKGEANFAASNTCIEYLPSGHAWFVTGGQVARVYQSNDHGESWTLADTPMIDGNQASGTYSVAFANEKEGILVGGTWDQPALNKDIAAYTRDGGQTWQLAETMPGAFRSCVQYFKDDNREINIAIGKTGCDYSLDKGNNWTPVASEGYYTLRAVPGRMSGFAAGSRGRIALITIE
ncbi:oxidoreductase [Marinilabiliaceae bacterium JC017]|nr:oxidoreductase [Marinilabiliaceae bacterium JC017]